MSHVHAALQKATHKAHSRAPERPTQTISGAEPRTLTRTSAGPPQVSTSSPQGLLCSQPCHPDAGLWGAPRPRVRCTLDGVGPGPAAAVACPRRPHRPCIPGPFLVQKALGLEPAATGSSACIWPLGRGGGGRGVRAAELFFKFLLKSEMEAVAVSLSIQNLQMREKKGRKNDLPCAHQPGQGLCIALSSCFCPSTNSLASFSGRLSCRYTLYPACPLSSYTISISPGFGKRFVNKMIPQLCDRPPHQCASAYLTDSLSRGLSLLLLLL